MSAGVSRLDAALAALGWEGARVTPLEGGITNRNFRVDVEGGPYVVRVPGDNTDLLGIDRSTERAASLAAAELGIGPPVVAALPDLGTVVCRFVPGEQVAPERLRRPPLVGALAFALRRFHDLPFTLPTTFSAFAVVDDYAAEATRRGVVLPDAYRELSVTARRIEAVVGELADARPCHNDLLAGNVLVHGDDVVLLDYEYAGMGDPYFDLGNLSVNAEFDDVADRRLLDAYHAADGGATVRRLARLKLMRVMSAYREGMWGVLQQALSTLDTDFVAYAAEHLDRAVALALDPRFDDWLTKARTADTVPDA